MRKIKNQKKPPIHTQPVKRKYELPTIDQLNELGNEAKESADLSFMFGLAYSLMAVNLIKIAVESSQKVEIELDTLTSLFCTVILLLLTPFSHFYFQKRTLNQISEQLTLMKRESDLQEIVTKTDLLKEQNSKSNRTLINLSLPMVALFSFAFLNLFNVNKSSFMITVYPSVCISSILSYVMYFCFPQLFKNTDIFKLTEKDLLGRNILFANKLLPESMDWRSNGKNDQIKLSRTFAGAFIQLDDHQLNIDDYFKILKASFKSVTQNSKLKQNQNTISVDLTQNRLDEDAVQAINQQLIIRAANLNNFMDHKALAEQIEHVTAGVLTWIPSQKLKGNTVHYTLTTTRIPATSKDRILNQLNRALDNNRIRILGDGSCYIRFEISGSHKLDDAKFNTASQTANELTSLFTRTENNKDSAPQKDQSLQSKPAPANSKEKPTDTKSGYVANLGFFSKIMPKNNKVQDPVSTFKSQIDEKSYAKIALRNTDGLQTGWLWIDEDNFSQLSNPDKLISIFEDYELGSHDHIVILRQADQADYGGAHLKLVRFIDAGHSDWRGVFRFSPDLKSADGLPAYEFGIKKKHENAEVSFSRKNIDLTSSTFNVKPS